MSGIPTKKLSEALASVARFATGRTSIPEYQKVVLESSKGVLEIRAHNACGSIAVATSLPYDGARAVVEHSALHRAIARANVGEVDLEATGSALRLQAGSMEIVLPSEDIEIPRPQECPTTVSASPAAFSGCTGKVVMMDKDVELAIAQGQRILTDSGGLYLLASNSHGMAGASLDYEGGELDVVVLHKSVLALVGAVSGDSVSPLQLGESGGWLYAQCGGVTASLPTVGGTKPYAKNAFTLSVQKAVEWQLCKSELMEFLQQVAVFATPEATAITLTPVQGGARAVFDGMNNDGTPSISASGKCSAIIPGECSGQPVRMNHTYLRNIITHCADDYRMWRGSRAVLVESGNYFAAYAMMGGGQ